MTVRRVALLTAGGFAPCLSSAVGGLIERYSEIAPDVEIIAYQPRVFVPVDQPSVLAAVLARHPVGRIEAAAA